MKSTVALALSCFCAQVPFFLSTYATHAFLFSPHSEQTNKNASGWKHQLHRQACQHPLRKRNPISCKLAGILPSCLHIFKKHQSIGESNHFASISGWFQVEGSWMLRQDASVAPIHVQHHLPAPKVTAETISQPWYYHHLSRCHSAICQTQSG